RAPAPGAPPGAGKQAARAPAPGAPPGAGKQAPTTPAPSMPSGAGTQAAEQPSPAAPPHSAAEPAPQGPSESAGPPFTGAPQPSRAPSAVSEAAEPGVPFENPAPAETEAGEQPLSVQEGLEQLPAVGNLAETSLFRLAYLVLAHKETCLVTVRGKAGFDLYFQKGAPFHAASADPELEVGAWLVMKGALTAQIKEQAEQAAPNFGGSFTGALFASGLADPGVVFPHLSSLGNETWLRALALSEGLFEVSLGQPPPPDAIPLGVPTGKLLAEAARRLKTQDLDARLGSRARAPAMRTNASVMEIEDLGLGPQEARLATMFDGVRSPVELAEVSGAGIETSLRLAWLLGECGFISFGEAAPQETVDSPEEEAAAAGGESGQGEPAQAGPAAPETAGAPPAGAAVAATPEQAEQVPAESSEPSVESAERGGTEGASSGAANGGAQEQVDWAEERKRISELEKRWKTADHFRVLGVPKQCGDDEIRQAFNALARKYHPDRVAMAPSDVQTSYRELFERVRSAYGVIGTSAKRRSYLNELAEREISSTTAAAPVSGEETLQKVRHLVKGRHYEQADELLDEALASNPGLAAGWAWRALLKVLRAKDAAEVQGEARTMIERALSIDPRSREVHLLAARVAKRYGESATCARHEQQAAALKKA
ncbi:MAG: DUF4388 domain-containing protein, partial [Myxococcota bacterium]